MHSSGGGTAGAVAQRASRAPECNVSCGARQAAFTVVFSFQVGVITSYWDTQVRPRGGRLVRVLRRSPNAHRRSVGRVCGGARPLRSSAVVARGIHAVPPLLLIPISPWHARAPGGRAACRAAWRRSSGTAAQLLQRARAALSRSSSHGRPPHGASSSKGLSARTHRAPQAVLTALVATAGVVAVCCALAFLTPLDFTKCARSRPGAGAAAPAHAEGWHMALTLTITLKAVPVLARCSSATLTWVLAAPVSVRGAAPL